MAKKQKVIQFLQEEKPEVLTITETHLRGTDEITIAGYEWKWKNFEKAIRENRGVGILIKQGIQYKVMNTEVNLLEEGRSIGIEIGTTRLYVLYMPVNTDPSDRII